MGEVYEQPTNQAGIYARINFAQTLTTISNKKDIAEILASSVQQAKVIGDERAESYALGSLGEVYEQPTNQAGIYARINFAQTLTTISNKKDIAEILICSFRQAKVIGDERAPSYALESLGEVYEQPTNQAGI